MALPLIPVIIWTTAFLAVGKGTYDTIDASQRIKAAKARYERRRNKYKRKLSNYNLKRKNAQKSFEELGKVRLESLVVLGKVADVLKKAKVKERDLENKLSIRKQKLQIWKIASVRAIEILGGIAKAGVTGASTAAAAYGLVGIFGTASTGTAIATLSGAAATNATLAWLGGGSLAVGGGGVTLGTLVLGGIVAGPALLLAGFFAQGKAGQIENEVKKNIAKMEIAEVKMDQQLAVLNVMLKRISELKSSTITIRKKVEEILKQTTSKSSLKDLYFLARTAKSLGDLLDVAILDKKGKLLQ